MYRKRQVNLYFLLLFIVLIVLAALVSGSVYVFNLLKKDRERQLLPGIVCFGDSLTAGYIPDSNPAPYADTLKRLIQENYCNTDVVNFGASGEDSATITARSGAEPLFLSKDVLLPEDTSPVEIELEDKTGRRLVPLMYMDSGFNSCTLNGIEGTLENKFPGSKEGIYSFRRTAPGEPSSVPKGSKLIPASARLCLDHIPIIFMGTNGGFSSYEELIEQTDAVIRYRSAGAGGKYVVVGMYNGKAEWLDGYDQMMYRHYKEHFISLRSFLAFHGLDSAGLLYKEEDLNAMDSVSVPPSLLSDQVHLTKDGYEVLGRLIFDKMDELGYFDGFKEGWMPFSFLPGKDTKEKKETMKFVKELPNGINIGNTLDSYPTDGSDFNELDIETFWGNPSITEKYIDGLKESGISLLRIPVTWDIHTDEAGKLSAVWLGRVKQVVHYAYGKGMYIILDMHHDKALYPGYEDLDKNAYRLSRIWKQIAYEFRDYDKKLIFEGLNEPRLYDTEIEWGDGNEDTSFCLYVLNRSFIDAVRSSGGKNGERYLIIGGYHTGSSEKILSDIKIPSDTHLIIGVHAYLPYDFVQTTEKNSWRMDRAEDIREIDDLRYNLTEFETRTGLPVIVTEFACIAKGEHENDRREWCRYYLESMNGRSIPCIWWDDGDESEYALFDRTTGEPLYPELCSFFICSEPSGF